MGVLTLAYFLRRHPLPYIIHSKDSLFLTIILNVYGKVTTVNDKFCRCAHRWIPICGFVKCEFASY